MNDKRQIALTIVAVAVLAISIISASFAYFSASITKGSSNFTASTAAMSSAFSAVGTNCGLNVSADKMMEGSVNSTVAVATSDDCKVEISYASSANGTAMYCTYNIMWDWTSADTYLTHSPVSVGSSTKYTGNEFTVKGTASSNPAVATNQNTITNNLSTEKDWTQVTTNANPVQVGSGKIWSNSTTATKHTWIYQMKFYNAPAYQNALAGKSFAGKFYVDQVVC